MISAFSRHYYMDKTFSEAHTDGLRKIAALERYMWLEQETPDRWYAGITRYQWLVLVIASLGWVFDVFEGQIFVASMNEAMPELLPTGATRDDLPFYNNITFAAFLIGGALGGVLFGRLGDRIGRTHTMVYTIMVYSLFTCLSALSRSWWHMALFRFLVAMGVGGEWAVATALVAEVFPSRARSRSLAIFHASSVIGTLLAVAAGVFLVGNSAFGWRWGFALGAAPALLVIWIRLSLKEPERAKAIKDREPNPPLPSLPPLVGEGTGGGNSRLVHLFGRHLIRHTLIGVGLATVGLATFWGTHIYGKDVLRRAVEAKEVRLWPTDLDNDERESLMKEHLAVFKRWEMAGMLLVTTGGGLGLVCFGPLAERLGRRGAFLLFHVGGFAASVLLFQLLSGILVVMLFLPVFGFLTLGLHAGYAVYFPELFPTALRSTGAGFCFNVGRFLAAPILFLSGWLQQQSQWGLTLENAATLLSTLFLSGILLLAMAPETQGQDLPE